MWATVFLALFIGPFAVKEFTGSFALGGLSIPMYPLSNLLVVLPAGRVMRRVGRAPILAPASPRRVGCSSSPRSVQASHCGDTAYRAPGDSP